MAEKIVMLALSPTMETGTIVKWLKKEGDKISSGDIICEVETDKATMDYESTVEGTLLKITSGEGSKVKVGEMIGIAGNAGEDISGLLQESEPVSETQKKATIEEPQKPQMQNIAPKVSEEHVPETLKASPLAKNLARQSGIELQSIKGTGPGGRIVKEDIEHATQKRTIPPKEEKTIGRRILVSDKRRIIAQRMSQSMYSAPHYYVTISVQMDNLIESRNKLNRSAKSKISFNAFLIKLVAESLHRNPVINSSWNQDVIIRHDSVDIGLAVAQKEGLITPVIRDCINKGILAIDGELNDLVDRARIGKLSVQEYTGGTFTISNLGSYGVRQFTAIINPPEAAILAVGEIFQEQHFNENGECSIHKSMLMTLSCDHRVIDGAIAAEFARDLKNIIENPITVLY